MAKTVAAGFAVPEPDASAPLAGLRRQAWRRFQGRGVPHAKDEVWRTTDLRTLRGVDWQPAPPAAVDAAALAPHLLPDTHRLVFVDGRHAPGHDDAMGLPGVTVAPLAKACDHPVVREHLGHIQTGLRHPFADWNTAAFEDGALVHLEPRTVLKHPVHILFLATGAPDTVHHPRTLVVAGPDSEATVVSHHVGAGHERSLANGVTELLALDGARLRHVRLQQEAGIHLDGMAVEARRDATVDQLNVQVGAAQSRTTIDALLAAEGATVALDGLFLTRGTQATDIYTRIDHAVPHGTSSELYKGILDGRSHGAFTGNILVREGAQQTASEQENRNLLLSREALVDSTPQLEIHADDVKCSHGTTVGQLDPDALFFLRSRGIPEEKARLMLVQGFAREVTEKAPFGALKDRLEHILQAWFGGRA